MKFKHSKKVLLALALLSVLVVAGGFGYAKYNELKQENQRLSDPQEVAKAEASRLKAEVSQVYELPNEDPTIATVIDVNKLKPQAFFANAQNDDKVLIFTQAKLAILYRPSTKKIIQVAPLSIGDDINTE